MRRGRTYDWIPLWRQKWLWGSTRLELDPAERSVWIDFLCIAGNDDGHIRANETTPYPQEQLAGMLRLPVDVLKSTITKCLKNGKLKKDKLGCLYVCSWKQYQLTGRHKRRFGADAGSSTPPQTETNTDTERETQVRTPGHHVRLPGHKGKASPPSDPGLIEEQVPKGLPWKIADELRELKREHNDLIRLADDEKEMGRQQKNRPGVLAHAAKVRQRYDQVKKDAR